MVRASNMVRASKATQESVSAEVKRTAREKLQLSEEIKKQYSAIRGGGGCRRLLHRLRIQQRVAVDACFAAKKESFAAKKESFAVEIPAPASSVPRGPRVWDLCLDDHRTHYTIQVGENGEVTCDDASVRLLHTLRGSACWQLKVVDASVDRPAWILIDVDVDSHEVTKTTGECNQTLDTVVEIVKYPQ